MAETGKSEQPQTNGLENGLDEDERSKMRPADIDADVKEMERRKRVEMIMSSKLFREELERIIELQLKDGNGPAGLLQQISDMMGIQSGKLHTTHMFRGSNCVTPINDIRGVESMGYEKGEKNLRCKLASVFRLMDLYGWSQGINNQITARLNQDEEHFLVNPHGMLFNEITASSLVKVDMQGNVVEPGTTNFSVNTQGFLLHSAIHASRPDVNCVIHIKTPSVLAVSSLKCGLLPICQEALVIGEVSQHPFVSGIFEPEEREKIIRNLGPHNKVLLLHNHGAVCCGATVEEAFYNVYNTVLACETQMKLMPMGVENLLLVSDETRKQVYDAAHRAPDAGTSDKKKFRVGEMEFEALIRMLDNAGFRTGYIYRHPLVKGELPKPKNDVEVPPAVSSLGYLIEQEELYKQGNWKKYVDGRNRLDRTKWLNSPNVYQKVEILETGTSDPKKITKWVDQNSEEWVAESSPTHSSTPVKIDSALQFVPKGTNPKEFKKLQQQIKENRRADKITSGPQSHILEGVSWEEAKKLQDANITQTGDQVILVGAASKGIIQRNYQHNALVYKTPYAKNPFDSMSDKEIEDYKQLVERKQRGDTDYEESQSESEAISSSRQDALRHFKSPLLSPQSATSETEEESRDEPRVLRIETKTAPRPIQAEVVLSDGESDTTDARVERSHSARFPKAEKPESVTLMNSFRKSWSLKREKDKSKDVENIYDSRNVHLFKKYELDRTESLHCYVARVKQLTHKPIIVNLGTKSLRPLLKSASDPCNLSILNEGNAYEIDNRQPGTSSLDLNTSLSCGNIVKTSELQQRLNVRKKLLHSAKMKFLGYQNPKKDSEVDDNNSKSPMRILISEIRDTINEIMSPERSKQSNDVDYFDSMKWINRSKLISQSSESKVKSKDGFDDLTRKLSTSKSLGSLNFYDAPTRSPSETFTEFSVLKMDLENNERSDTSNCNCAIHGVNSPKKPLENPNEGDDKTPPKKNITEVASEDEATYTVTDDSLLPTYSFTESTETEWYYNKTIMKLENSQTVLEIKECENKGENLEIPVKYIDTGIDTDFTSDKEVEIKANDPPAEEQKEQERLETTEDLDNDAPICESSGLNKSSETDSSFLKSSSGRTSNDVDTSFAFKTETENSEKTNDKSPDKGSNPSVEEKKKFLEEMLQKTKEPIQEESSDSEEANLIPEKKEKTEANISNSGKILESPEFTNVDTEDAPITSSSKDTSPEILGKVVEYIEDEPKVEPKVDAEEEKENVKTEHKKKKNVKSATKITVKKELKEKDSNKPVVSEIRLTIKNRNKCQSEKYEVKIQDVTNTSEDLSRSVSSAGENVEGYESFEIVDKNCDCEAQQNLEDLQDEVSSTIEKLQTIENYFEDEIKKQSKVVSPRKKRNGSDEFTIEYNYREFEEVLNESKIKMAVIEKDLKDSKPIVESPEFFLSSPLGEICGEIEVCDDGDVFEETGGSDSSSNKIQEDDMKHLAMSSAFVAAVLSEAVLGVGETVEEETQLEVICNLKELTNAGNEVEFYESAGELYYLEEEETNKEELQENQQQEEILKVPEDEKTSILNLEKEDVVKEEKQVHQQEETDDGVLNQEIHIEEPEDEKTYQDCQSRFDLDKKEYPNPLENQQEENVDCNGHILEGETIFQDCQQKLDVSVPEEPKEEDQQVIEEHQYLEQEENFDLWNKEIQSELPEDETTYQSCQSMFDMEKCEQPEESELQEYQLNYQEIDHYWNSDTQVERLGNENTDQGCQLICDSGEYKENTNRIQSEELGLQENQLCYQEIDHCWNSDTQVERLGNENTDQGCQLICDSGEYKQPEESELQEYQLNHQEIDHCWNGETQIERLGNENTDQGCQLKYDSLEEADQQSREGVDHYSNTEIQQENEIIRERCQLNFDIGKDEQAETDQQEIQEYQQSNLEEEEIDCDGRKEIQNEETGNETVIQDCQPMDDLKEKIEIESCDEQQAEECQQILEIINERFDETQEYQQSKDFDGESVKNVLQNLEPSLKDKNEELEIESVDETQNYQHLKIKEHPQSEINDLIYNPPEDAVINDTVEIIAKMETLNEVTDHNIYSRIPELIFRPPLKAITFEPNTKTVENTLVYDILNSLLNTIAEKSDKINDVINFIITNEESPTDSLTEFEDMENIISTSSSVVADIIDSIESQMEEEVECLPYDDEFKDLQEVNKKKRKKDAMFKVTIATPSKKEIFINYSLDKSSTFNTTSDLDQIEEVLSNSYIKTDEVNEDFENISSDNPDFFSMESSGKNSLNNSFCSVEDSVKNGVEQFCCFDCETNGKSPVSLAIIQEVDEGDSSASEVAAS